MATESSTLIPDSMYAKLCGIQVAAEALFAQEAEGCPAHVSVPLIADLGAALYGENDPRVKALRPKKYTVFHGSGGDTGKFYIQCGARTVALCPASDEANLVCDALNERCEAAPPTPKEVKFRVGDWVVLVGHDEKRGIMLLTYVAPGGEMELEPVEEIRKLGERPKRYFIGVQHPSHIRHATPKEIARARGE